MGSESRRLRRAAGGALSAKGGGRSRDRTREVLLYVGVFAFTLIAAYLLLGLVGADFRVLWRNSYDARSAAVSAKGFIEHGSWVTNPSIGAPGGSNMLDYPGADFLNVVLLSIIALIVRHAQLAVNLYYLLGYPLAAMSAVFVFRRFSLSRPVSALAGILFAFIPYHYMRGTAHLFLSEYWIVPLIFYLALQLGRRCPPFFSTSEEDALKFDVRPRSALAPVLIAAAIATTGVYYAYFAMFFLAIAGIRAAVRHASLKRLYSAAGLVGIILATLFAQLLPTIFYRISNGPNPGGFSRSSFAADVYGLRLSQLLLPSSNGHRIESVSGWAVAYWQHFFGLSKFGPVETAYVTLGVLAGVGLVALLVWPLLAGMRTPGSTARRLRSLMDPLSVFAWGGLLLGTTGGVGAIVGISFALIRCYNRISIFLAFLALFALGLLLDLAAARLPGRETGRGVALWALCAVLLGVGLFDQVVPAALPNYQVLAAKESSDSQIVGAVEARLPKDAMVFQMPYIPFPEGGSLDPWPGTMADYQHFRAPMQSVDLRWSYGTMKGRPGDEWYRHASRLSAKNMVAELKTKGFSAIWVDRNGYDDGGRQIESEFQTATGSAPLVSPDGEISVFIIQ